MHKLPDKITTNDKLLWSFNIKRSHCFGTSGCRQRAIYIAIGDQICFWRYKILILPKSDQICPNLITFAQISLQFSQILPQFCTNFAKINLIYFVQKVFTTGCSCCFISSSYDTDQWPYTGICNIKTSKEFACWYCKALKGALSPNFLNLTKNREQFWL